MPTWLSSRRGDTEAYRAAVHAATLDLRRDKTLPSDVHSFPKGLCQSFGLAIHDGCDFLQLLGLQLPPTYSSVSQPHFTALLSPTPSPLAHLDCPARTKGNAYRKVGACGPNAVASQADDCGLVDVTGGDEAILTSVYCRCTWTSRIAESLRLYREGTSNRCTLSSTLQVSLPPSSVWIQKEGSVTSGIRTLPGHRC